MFAEHEFETDSLEEGNSCCWKNDDNTSDDKAWEKQVESGNTLFDLHFHAPGDAQYSVVAQAKQEYSNRKKCTSNATTDSADETSFNNKNTTVSDAKDESDSLTVKANCALHDINLEQVVNGDAWLSSECHCLRCESLRVIASLNEIQTHLANENISTTQRKDLSVCNSVEPIVLILLDLDNYGFNHFKTYLPQYHMKRKRETAVFDKMPNRNNYNSSASIDCVDRMSNEFIINHVFVWAFYSSCFARYHKVFPTRETLCSSSSQHEHEGNSESNNNFKYKFNKETIWEKLCSANRVHLTPCGGQSQAVDDVIVEVATLFHQRQSHVLVITGDTKLIKHLRQFALIDDQLTKTTSTKRIKCENNNGKELKDKSNDCQRHDYILECINVHDYYRKATLVWRAIAHFVANVAKRTLESILTRE